MKEIAEKYGIYYVGGHPMAGTERSGYSESKASLFEGASMILTDCPDSLFGLLREFFLSVGFGRINHTSPEEHDRMIAYTSQLAHVSASAYVKSEHALKHTGFSAGSFGDMSRVAYLNEDMWTELFIDNSDYLAEEVEAFAQRLLEYAKAIKNKERESLHSMLAEGRERKEMLDKSH